MKTDKELRENYLRCAFARLKNDNGFFTIQISDGVGGKTNYLNLESHKLDELLNLMLAD
tara:strand:+ start:87 stop:263 length:177 start_codon:yes stop_codon:yes gene_type:complete